MNGPGKGRRGLGLTALFAVLAALGLLFAASASATQYQRPFVETFGSAEQPSFELPAAIAVDPISGDVLVGDITDLTFPLSGEVKRFNPDGTPAPFAALGSNVIDGKAGPGGKPCAEEPASCDQTPQGKLGMDSGFRQQFAVDPINGNLYVTQRESDLVDIFSAEGKYLGQLTAAGTKKFDGPCGVVVDSGGAVYVAQGVKINKFVAAGAVPVNADNTANFDIGFEAPCHMALGNGPSAGSIFITNNGGNKPGPRLLKVNKETGALSEFAKGFQSLVTVDPTSGNPLVGVLRPDIQDSGKEAVEFDGAGTEAGAELSRMIVESGTISDFAASGSGDIFVVPSLADTRRILVYGAPAVVPTVTVDPPADVTGSTANLSGTVNPEGIAIDECFFEYGVSFGNGFTDWKYTVPCEESIPTDSSEHTVHASISGLAPNGEKYNFRLVARNQNGAERSPVEALTTALTTATEAAAVTGLQSATLHGTVRPEGLQYTECFFEWGLTTNADFEHTAPCDPAAGAIPTDFAPHAVSAALSGLQEARKYRFRLVGTTSAGTVAGKELTFETFGKPQIEALRARDADRSSVTIEAEIDPSGFDTSYRFEWGPTASYGNVAPASFEPIGSGTEPVRVSVELTALPTASTWHYRVVASGPGGTVVSADQIFETLNSCGLPEARCFELVSRTDAGPAAIPGESGPTLELDFQAATAGPGGFAYLVEGGYPDATKGFEVLYGARRGPSGWASTQLSTPIVDQNEQNDPNSLSGRTAWLSKDLSCGFAESSQPLTDDPGSRLLYESGGPNFYRLNSDGSYTAVTRLAPESLGFGSYTVAGASQDCGKVAFSTGFRYPGIAAAGTKPLYEWEDGTLRNAGLVPGPSGEVVVAANAGAFNAVSEDGSRVFFSAARQTSLNSAEIGKQAIFVREDGAVTRDLSLSDTATPSGDATYQWATPDGSRVFFTANAGLTGDASPSGTDLYQYDLEAEELTDLSVNDRPGGAQVAGFVGASKDGSHVYFLARGQFFPGYGSTLAQNQSNNTYSLYGVSEGEVSFVATIGGSAAEVERELRSMAGVGTKDWNSRVSADGRYLLFQTAANVTGYESNGAQLAYLYDSAGGSEGTICISCRPDGQPPAPPGSNGTLKSFSDALKVLKNIPNPPQFLVVREGEPRVFFQSLEVLAPGAIKGQSNIYEWSHGQVFRLTSAREGQNFAGRLTAFLGASEDGSDVYLGSPETLNWEDPDERLSVYDARIGGGFPEPTSPVSCDPDAEGSCQGPGQGPAGTVPGAASATFNGPGNVKPAAKKKQKKKHAKKKQKKSKGKGRKKQQGKGKQKHGRTAGADRGAGK